MQKRGHKTARTVAKTETAISVCCKSSDVNTLTSWNMEQYKNVKIRYIIYEINHENYGGKSLCQKTGLHSVHRSLVVCELLVVCAN